VNVNRLLHVVFGNFVAANDVSRTSSPVVRVSEVMSTPNPRKAMPYVEGMTLMARHSFLIVPLATAFFWSVPVSAKRLWLPVVVKVVDILAFVMTVATLKGNAGKYRGEGSVGRCETDRSVRLLSVVLL
jgi:hypothetical protein